MTKPYKAPKTINEIVKLINRMGLGRSETLATVGRRTGERREVPITPITVDGQEYLVAPYGEVSWVKNLRSNPEADLRRGKVARRCRMVEVTEDGAPIVMAYWKREKYPRGHMGLGSDPTPDDFERAKHSFPVFRIDSSA